MNLALLAEDQRDTMQSIIDCVMVRAGARFAELLVHPEKPAPPHSDVAGLSESAESDEAQSNVV